jgi:hypothetical protein
MNKWLKISLLTVSVLVIGLGLMAFRGLGNPREGDGSNGHTAALAEALGISVEDLESAYEAVHVKIINQAVDEGLLTQEQADQILSQDAQLDGRQMKSPGHFDRGENFNELLAEELGIGLEDLLTAYQQVEQTMLEQAYADGKITQDEYERIQLRLTMKPYLQEAMQTATQNAIDAALEDGAITQEQADLLMENSNRFEPGIGGPMFGPHPGRQPFFHHPFESGGD